MAEFDDLQRRVDSLDWLQRELLRHELERLWNEWLKSCVVFRPPQVGLPLLRLSSVLA